MPIGFTHAELLAYPDAFYPVDEKNICFGLPAIKYKDIPVEGTAANKIFKEKLKFHLKNYDEIRLDAGWSYFTPSILDLKTGEKSIFLIWEIR